MRKKSLNALYGSYAARSRSLLSRSAPSLPADPAEMMICEPIHRDSLAFLVVRLQHLWGEFCRELVVRSALGGCVTRTGVYLPPAAGVNRVRDIPNIIKQFTKEEFSGSRSHWEDPSFAIRHTRRLQVANFNQISLGLGSVTILDHLKSVRNFIVHPNSNTGPKYLQTTRTLGFRGMPPIQLINQHSLGGATIFEMWVLELESAAWVAVA